MTINENFNNLPKYNKPQAVKMNDNIKQYKLLLRAAITRLKCDDLINCNNHQNEDNYECNTCQIIREAQELLES